MPHKSWKAKHRRKEPAAQPAPRQPTDPMRLETIIERKAQAQIYEDLIRKHRGDVPARECWNHLADRREAAIITSSRVPLAWG